MLLFANTNTARRAFTYIELIVIIIFISILTGIVIDRFREVLLSKELDKLIGEVETALESARLGALTSGRAYRVTFISSFHRDIVDGDEMRITVEREVNTADLSAGTIPKGTIEAQQWEVAPHPFYPDQLYDINYYDNPKMHHFRFMSPDFGGDTTVVFDNRGRPDSGGSIGVRWGSNTWMGYTRGPLITLDADTGQLSSEYITW
jgi:type II secretory pathway pseudopilin PulG